MNKPKPPLVSVVIPVYNVARYIEEAIHSVLQQTFTGFEIIVVDDASPDNSIELVNAINDSRIKIISQANRGLAGARNTGIRHAKGEFIAFLDSDDYWQPEKLAQHIKLMQHNTHCGVSFSASLFVDENSQSLNKIQAPLKQADYTASDIFCRNPIGNGSAPVIRKDILEKIAFNTDDKPDTQYFDETLKQSEDVECWTRIALTTHTEFHYLNQPLTYYRLNHSGLSANVEKQFQTWQSVLDKITNYAPDFAQQYGTLAKAYQLRYLARRQIFEGQAKQACQLVCQALKTDKRILFKEPKRTLETLFAALVLSLLSQQRQLKIVERLMH